MPKGGYMGKFARVNLTDGKVEVGNTFDYLPEEVLRRWIGGRGQESISCLRRSTPR